MRHRRRGRKLGRNPNHQRALLRSLASALFLTERDAEGDDNNRPRSRAGSSPPWRRPRKCGRWWSGASRIARRALPHQEAADELEPNADRNSEQWRAWRQSERWQEWSQAIAPVVAARRRALRLLGDKQAVQILFDDIAPRFADRDGGYTRVLRLAKPRLGDAGTRAILELVGKNDRVRREGGPAVVRVRRAPQSQPTAPPRSIDRAASETRSDCRSAGSSSTVAQPSAVTFSQRRLCRPSSTSAADVRRGQSRMDSARQQRFFRRDPPRPASTSPSTCAGCATTWSPGWTSFGTSTCRGWR